MTQIRQKQLLPFALADLPHLRLEPVNRNKLWLFLINTSLELPAIMADAMP